MLRLLTTLGRGFKEKIGWKRLGIAASVLIIALAITSLVHTLKGVDTGVILTALTDIAPHRIALAALCVVGAFCTLTFYDFFALRTIGKTHVPYRIAALSSFTSYTIGHNIGATVFTGGAIRFRIYSDYGLSAIDVAKICFLSGLTFWLGNLFVLGFGMAWHPAAASAMTWRIEASTSAGFSSGIMRRSSLITTLPGTTLVLLPPSMRPTFRYGWVMPSTLDSLVLSTSLWAYSALSSFVAACSASTCSSAEITDSARARSLSSSAMVDRPIADQLGHLVEVDVGLLVAPGALEDVADLEGPLGVLVGGLGFRLAALL